MRNTQRQRNASIGWSPWRATMVLMALLIGCQSTVETGDSDRDNDGLTNTEEAALGTDPDNPDSDGDTLLDGAEVEAGTSPLAADSDGDGLRDDIDPDPLVPEGMGATEPEVQVTDQEIEPNGTFSTANRPIANSDDQIVARGAIDEAGDIDVFDIGAVNAGDVLRISVSALDDSLDAALAVFDDQGLLVIDNDDADFGAGLLDPSIELTARRDGDPYYVAVTPS
ncbi:MAG: PPC domain-containing protein, partial [Planctomycetes bacterium]|nr:PPC domain-containing protein [Planctomycetota bacterium]